MVIISILNLPAFAIAAETGDGIIEGRIINGTEGGSSVANQDIILKTYLNDDEVNTNTIKTDADGQFIFGELPTDSSYSYEITITFHETDYYSRRLSFDAGEITKSVEVTIYDSTTSDEAIKVATSHTVIYVEPDSLRVEEYFLFINDSDRTYIGSKEITTDGTKETLRLPMPAEATGPQLGNGIMECCIVSSDDGFVDTMPVLPGSKELAYTYSVSHNSGTYTFYRKVDYPTETYNFVIRGEDTRVASAQLTMEELLNIEGIPFQYLYGEELPAGNTLVTKLSNLPEEENQGAILPWLVITLVVLAGGFIFAYRLIRRRPQPVTPDTAHQITQKLLLELARLDDEHETGKIPEDIFQRLRAEKKTQLVELMRQSKE